MAVVISQLVVVAQTRFGVGRYIHAMCDFLGRAIAHCCPGDRVSSSQYSITMVGARLR